MIERILQPHLLSLFERYPVVGEILVHGGAATGLRFGAQVTDPAGFATILGELEDSLVNGGV